MPVILFCSNNNDDPAAWQATLAEHFDDLDFRSWPDQMGDPSEIEYALVWAPPAGVLASCVNLKAIYGLGQGVDHIFADPQLPENIPILRIVDPWMSQAMSEWCLLHVLRFHRQALEYAEITAAKAWTKLPFPDTAKRRVGIMGLGALGSDLAGKLTALGFPVRGWSRSPKNLPGVTSFAGEDALADFLADTEILVNLLPLTLDTRDLMTTARFNQMPAGSFVINAGRGATMVEPDLLAAINAGQIAGAALDVFCEEPLPQDHVFWGHAKIDIWPHVAAQTNPDTATRQIVDNIRRLMAGEKPVNEVNFNRQY